MAELEPLPDLEVNMAGVELLPGLEVKQPPKNAVQKHEIPGLDHPVQDCCYPKMIMIKKQLKPALWHTPEQDFQIVKYSIDATDMASFDQFIVENVPKDPAVHGAALKFIESVLLAKTTAHESPVFYNDGKNKSFRISFLL